jgi:integrase
MARQVANLTQARVNAIKEGEELYDGALPGLSVRAGLKRTVWRVRVAVAKDGPNWRFKSEVLGDIRSFDLDAARKQAKIVIGRLLEKHGDPDRERRETQADQLTLETAWTSYINRCRFKGRSERTIDEYEQMLERHFSDWKGKTLTALAGDRNAFDQRFMSLTRTKGKYAANGAVRAFRAVWNHARRKNDTLPEGPFLVLDGLNKTEDRKIAYTPEELPSTIDALWQLDPIRAGYHFTLFLTGVRGGGLRTAKREHFDRKDGTLYLENHKGKPFTIPLSPALISLLDCMMQIGAERFPRNPFLFPAHSGEGCIIDARAAIPVPAAFAAHRKKHGRKIVKSVRTHQWRNSYISLAKMAGVGGTDCRMLVDHAVKRDAHDGYDTPMLTYLKERQHAMSKFLLAAAKLGGDFKFTLQEFETRRKDAKTLKREIRKAPELLGLI